MSNISTFIIPNVSLAYPKLSEPVENKFGTISPVTGLLAKQYDVRIDFPTERVDEIVRLTGRSPRVADENTMCINLKANEFNAKKQSNKPKVIDSQKQELSEDMVRNMGNGTKANVLVLQYPSKRDGKPVNVLKAIQVTEYKRYEAESIDFDIVGEAKPTTLQSDF